MSVHSIGTTKIYTPVNYSGVDSLFSHNICRAKIVSSTNLKKTEKNKGKKEREKKKSTTAFHSECILNNMQEWERGKM